MFVKDDGSAKDCPYAEHVLCENYLPGPSERLNMVKLQALHRWLPVDT
jgi:hypothetical protein